MSVPNPLYNPAWEAIHDFHHAERTRLDTLVGDAYKNDSYGDDFDALVKERDAHHDVCLETFIMRHETVGSYAKWLFENFDVRGFAPRIAIPMPEMDYEDFQTIEEVREKWTALEEMVKEATNAKLYALPVGKPDNKDIFIQGTDNHVFSYKRIFTASDLYPPHGDCGNTTVSAFVTVDQRDGEFHICLGLDPNHIGQSVINAVEDVAGVLFREAVEMGKQHSGGKPDSWVGGILKSILAVVTDKGPQSEQFHFYTHTPPADYPFKESFSRVTMDYSNGRFSNPEWHEYQVIPDAVQTVRYDLMHVLDEKRNPAQFARLEGGK